MKELTGIGIYTRNLLEEMIPLDVSIQYTLFMNASKGPNPRNTTFQLDNVSLIRRRIPGKLLLECWRRVQYPKIEKLAGAKNCHIFHSPNFLYQPSYIKKVVTTVHDLTFLKNKNYGSKYSGAYHRDTLLENLNRASRIIVVSETVRNDLISICNIPADKVRVVRHGLDQRYRSSTDMQSVKKRLQQKGYPDRYILSVGTLESRKNFPMLIDAFSGIAANQPDLFLVIVGRFTEEVRVIEKKIQHLKLKDKVIMPGYIESALLIDLYQGAQLTVFPSWEEGFGFPPLEAAACGVPVVASDISAHREVLKDSALYFSHNNVNQLIEIVINLLMDENQKTRYTKAGLERAELYSWTEAAQEHINIYKELIYDENTV